MQTKSLDKVVKDVREGFGLCKLKTCGRPFKKARRFQKFCSASCRNQSYNKYKYGLIYCLICDKLITKPRATVYCSTACYREGVRRIKKGAK